MLSQTTNLNAELHSTISAYCETAEDSDYGATNFLLSPLQVWLERGIHGSAVYAGLVRQGGITVCPPRIAALRSGRDPSRPTGGWGCSESIRLLLLTCASHFRYNQVFALHAAQFAEAAVVLRSPAHRYRFIVRQGISSAPSMTPYRCSARWCSVATSPMPSGCFASSDAILGRVRGRCCDVYRNVVDQMVATYIFMGPVSTRRDFAIPELRSSTASVREPEGGWSERQRTTAIPVQSYTAPWWGEPLVPGLRGHEGEDPAELAIIIETAERLSRRYGSLLVATPALQFRSRSRRLTRQSSPMRCARRFAREFTDDVRRLSPRPSMRSSDAFDLVRELYVASLPLVSRRTCARRTALISNWSDCRAGARHHEIQGFTADPSVSNRLAFRNATSWESRLLDAVAWLGETNGRLYRSRAERRACEPVRSSNVSASPSALVSFSLAERAEWEDSYHLPEHLLPEIYGIHRDHYLRARTGVGPPSSRT